MGWYPIIFWGGLVRLSCCIDLGSTICDSHVPHVFQALQVTCQRTHCEGRESQSMLVLLRVGIGGSAYGVVFAVGCG